MPMTSLERFLAVLDRKPVDLTPIAVSPWGATVKRWRDEGHIGPEEDVAEHFDQDIRIRRITSTMRPLKWGVTTLSISVKLAFH